MLLDDAKQYAQSCFKENNTSLEDFGEQDEQLGIRQCPTCKDSTDDICKALAFGCWCLVVLAVLAVVLWDVRC